ncbi:hypothetical protein C8R43DRAFT_964074, partial [Mycena crocata]
AANVNVGIACVNNNLGGTCGDLNLNALPSVCVNVTPQFNDNISSFRLNSGIRCVFYKDGACTGSSRSFTGTTNDLFGDALQDNISAYQCFSRPRAERDSLPTENQFLRNKLQARSDGQRASTGHGSRVKVPVNSTVQQYSFNDGVNGPQHVLALINLVNSKYILKCRKSLVDATGVSLGFESSDLKSAVAFGSHAGRAGRRDVGWPFDGHTAQKLVAVTGGQSKSETENEMPLSGHVGNTITCHMAYALEMRQRAGNFNLRQQQRTPAVDDHDPLKKNGLGVTCLMQPMGDYLATAAKAVCRTSA